MKKTGKDTAINCGIIMPISSFGPYSEEFWGNVRSFLEEAIRCANMEPVPAWENDTNDVIHAKIIENIASLPVMVGVILGFNPNVMIECGMRLWTNQPILLLYGTSDKIPFDIGSISCLQFPLDFNYFKLVKLKKEIGERLKDLTSKQYKSFKAYYKLPQEVKQPKENKKIDFAQFVSETRKDIQTLKETLKTFQQQVEDTMSTTAYHKRSDLVSPLSVTAFSYPLEQADVSPPALSATQSIDFLTSTDGKQTNESSDREAIK